jgi:putative ABC transport system permease protein
LISGGSIDELVSNSMWAERYAFMILKGLASIALGLTVVGCFSVIAYTVDRRMTEFGVRVALGAQPFDLHRLVMVRSLTTTAIGLVIGTACALGLVRFMCSLLNDPFDPLVYASVAVVLICAGAVACWIPARRAARVDVVKLLRAD